MSQYPVHTIESAPDASKPLLEQTKSSYGFIPNLYGVFAESPAAIDAYIKIAGAFAKLSGFDSTEQQVVLLAVSESNECDYCVAAHSKVAEMYGVSGDVVAAIREGRALADPKLEALRAFTAEVVGTRGRPSAEAARRFHDAGYTRQHALSVLVGVAQKTLSNYTNHIADTPLDEAFAAHAWSRPAAVEA